MEEHNILEEKKVLSNAEIVELAKKQLAGIKYFGVGIKNDLLRVIINEIAAYEFMPVSLVVDDKEYIVTPIEEKVIDFENNHFKEAFYLKKNAFLEAQGKEKAEFNLNIKSKKKSAAMVLPESNDLLAELHKSSINLT